MMKISEVESKEELALRKLAKEYLPEQTSNDFTLKVMGKISADSSSYAYQPLISKKIWTLILSFLAVFIVVVLVISNKDSQQVTLVNTVFIKIIKLFSVDYPKILTSPLLAMSLFVMSSLFFLDYYIRNRKYS